MKKLLSLLLVMVLCLGTVAFAAENQDASFNKTYNLTNVGTTSPAETFTFKFTAQSVTEAPGVTVADMPAIPDAAVAYAAGEAGSATKTKAVNVALKDVEWPSVGIYTYEVKEVCGDTVGVTYDADKAYLKVTVAYDEGTNTYYTAFVTLSLADEDNDGTTDVKTADFTNTYYAGSLAITKTVTGNMGDQNKEFDVTVTFTVPQNLTVKEAITYVDGADSKTILSDDLADKSETVEITLKHGETVTFKNIPYGVSYTVVEADYTAAADGGYDAAAYNFSDADKVIDTASDTVTITNNKAVTVDTGIGLDSLPYVMILAFAAIGLVVFFTRKRMVRDN